MNQCGGMMVDCGALSSAAVKLVDSSLAQYRVYSSFCTVLITVFELVDFRKFSTVPQYYSFTGTVLGRCAPITMQYSVILE